jgi:hypothetical protein
MSAVEGRTQDILVLTFVFGSFGALILCSHFIPPPYGQWLGMFFYVFIVLGGFIFTDVWARYASAEYPYLEVIVRPSNKRLHLFVSKDESYDQRIRGTTDSYVLHIKTAYPIKYEDYGKVREFIICHRGALKDKVYFRPGWAVWKGLPTKHPQCDIIEVVQVSKATTSVDHGTPIPVFYMLHGSKDAANPILHAPAMVVSVGGPQIANQNQASPDALAELQRQVAELQVELNKVRRDAIEWQQRALAYEEIVEQQRAETSGLMEAKTGIKEHALELMLGFRQSCASFDRAIEALRGRGHFSFTKWVAITVIAGLVIAYLWANPEAAYALRNWFSQPLNTIIAAIVVIAIVGIIIGAERRRRK